jgi:predicted transcriptional regulator
MTTSRTLLLSLRPRYADAILSGNKTIEIRRRPVNAEPGTVVILYASSPRRAIVGTARMARVEFLSVEAGWRRFQGRLGVSRDEYDAYLDGVDSAYLLHLKCVNTLDQPLYLHNLRQEGEFRPPQSFRYVALSDPAPLQRLATATGTS